MRHPPLSGFWARALLNHHLGEIGRVRSRNHLTRTMTMSYAFFNPIGSIRLAHLPIFTLDLSQVYLQYTNPLDPLGNNLGSMSGRFS